MPRHVRDARLRARRALSNAAPRTRRQRVRHQPAAVRAPRACAHPLPRPPGRGLRGARRRADAGRRARRARARAQAHRPRAARACAASSPTPGPSASFCSPSAEPASTSGATATPGSRGTKAAPDARRRRFRCPRICRGAEQRMHVRSYAQIEPFSDARRLADPRVGRQSGDARVQPEPRRGDHPCRRRHDRALPPHRPRSCTSSAPAADAC